MHRLEAGATQETAGVAHRGVIMRASLLAVIAIALIAGLAVVFAVKALGLLNPPPPPPPPVVEKEKPPPPPPRPFVLIPAGNIFAGDAITGVNVVLRQLRADEMEDYNKNK